MEAETETETETKTEVEAEAEGRRVAVDVMWRWLALLLGWRPRPRALPRTATRRAHVRRADEEGGRGDAPRVERVRVVVALVTARARRCAFGREAAAPSSTGREQGVVIVCVGAERRECSEREAPGLEFAGGAIR